MRIDLKRVIRVIILTFCTVFCSTTTFLFNLIEAKAENITISSAIGTENLSIGEYVAVDDVTVNQYYNINGKTFICAENFGNKCYAMQATQMWSNPNAPWPGARISETSYIVSNWYNDDMKAIEDENRKYGLYLATKEQCGRYSNYEGQGSNYNNTYYWTGLKTAASSSDKGMWLSSACTQGSGHCIVWKSGLVDQYSNSNNRSDCGVAPVFNIDMKKCPHGTVMTANKILTKSTDLTIEQSIGTVASASKVDLTELLDSVTYVDGTNDGRAAQYKVEVETQFGTISGTTWNVTNDIITPYTVVPLTIRSTSYNLTKTVYVTILCSHKDKGNGVWVIDKEPTCTEIGLKHDNCSVCGEITNENTIIPAKGHIDNETWVIDKEPTCNEVGLKHTNCSVCGEILNQETIIPLTDEHIPTGNWIVDKKQTCTETGLMHDVCSICGKILNENTVIPASGHIDNETWVIDKEPTCTETGLQHTNCSVCGEILNKDTVIPAKGHVWSYKNSFVTVNPTPYKTGIRTFVCERDGTHICDKVEPTLQFSIFTGRGQTIYIYIGDNLISVPQSLKSSGIADLPTE